ncbi:hypothetical protein PILCRDRAFT_818609 [Piloderma croceum F 1598]|uniref:DUF6533 domain-containing protein n=1 Tax=Piloderma croceum (strain F 1598) TaxID=765440 RepID=A0A0C3BD79_PILCF|nr:hypothetical protein PILCRDRAFT_818609 [Piloderma croceum F 1598]
MDEVMAKDALLNSYLHLFSISILYYDWSLTFDLEISTIWRRPIKASTICFVLNRYFSVIGNVFITIFNMKRQSLQSCKNYDLSHQLFIIVNQTFVCVLLMLRTWALYNLNTPILLFMITIALLLLGVASWSQVGQQNQYATNLPGCNVFYSIKGGLHLAAAWEALLAFDSLIFVLTVLKTYKGRHRHHFISMRRINIVSLVLRDGATYYAVMALANLANILTFYLARPMLKGCLTSFASCISVTMMSRLMLNLHSAASAGIFSTSPTSDTSSGVAFTSRVPENLPFAMNSYQTDLELRRQSLQVGADFVARATGSHDIEME